MSVDIRSLKKEDIYEFDGFYAIYSTSFPQSEQKSREALMLMKDSLEYTVFIAYYDEKIAGFCIMYHPLNDDFFLLEYMAVDATLRGLGVGSTLLTQSIQSLFNTYGTRALLIEIDSPEKASHEQQIREKRELFYRRLGALKIDPFDYILPLQTNEEPPPMELLVYHPTMKVVSKDQLHQWITKLYVNVLLHR